MATINSHCSYCGNRFPESEPWPRHCGNCHNISYLNPLPVVVVMLPMEGGLIVIRRNIEPRKGTLNLPGGYLDLGETWQQGACRELREETGIALSDQDIGLFDVRSGLDHILVVFGLARPQPIELFKPFSSEETQEVVLVTEPIELGFPMHTEMMKRFFAGL